MNDAADVRDAWPALASLGAHRGAAQGRRHFMRTLPAADRRAWHGDPNVIWCTGPSKTADVEGILIEGVHGPGVQVALFVDYDLLVGHRVRQRADLLDLDRSRSRRPS
jgi:hypothetical protein